MADSAGQDSPPSKIGIPASSTADGNITSPILTSMDGPGYMEHSTTAIQPATCDLSPSTASEDDEDLVLTPTSSTPSESPTPEVNNPALINMLEEGVKELNIASAKGNEIKPANRANPINEDRPTLNQNSAGGKSGSQNIGQATSNASDPNLREVEREEPKGHLSRLSGGGGIWLGNDQMTGSPQAVRERRFISDGVDTRIIVDGGIRVVAREDFDDEIPNSSPSSISAQSVEYTVIEGGSIPNDPEPERLDLSMKSSNQPTVVDEIISLDSTRSGTSPGSMDHSKSPGSPVGQSDLVDQSMPGESYVQCSSDNNICNNDNTDNNTIVSSSAVPSTGGTTSFSSSNRTPKSPDRHFSNHSSNNNDNISIISPSFSFGTTRSTSSSNPTSHKSNSSQTGNTFRDQTLSGRTLNGATIRDCCLTSCSGRDLKITDCTFSSCNFSNATIKDRSFSGSSLQDCVNIRDCSFSGSSLHNCVLRDCSFSDSHVSGGSRRDCTWNRSNVH